MVEQDLRIDFEMVRGISGDIGRGNDAPDSHDVRTVTYEQTTTLLGIRRDGGGADCRRVIFAQVDSHTHE